MDDKTCTCTTLPDGIHYPACPESPYQAGVQSGRSQERARIVAWLRSYDDVQRRSALADRIENGEHVRRE